MVMPPSEWPTSTTSSASPRASITISAFRARPALQASQGKSTATDRCPRCSSSGSSSSQHHAPCQAPWTMPKVVVMRRTIEAAQLTRVCAGSDDVSTYMQSGNVVLTSTDSAAKVASALQKAIAKEFGIDVAVVVRTRQQLKKIIDGNPFSKKAEDARHLHVVFLAGKPKTDK